MPRRIQDRRNNFKFVAQANLSTEHDFMVSNFFFKSEKHLDFSRAHIRSEISKGDFLFLNIYLKYLITTGDESIKEQLDETRKSNIIN